jgi:hypothetical protein
VRWPTPRQRASSTPRPAAGEAPYSSSNWTAMSRRGSLGTNKAASAARDACGTAGRVPQRAVVRVGPDGAPVPAAAQPPAGQFLNAVGIVQQQAGKAAIVLVAQHSPLGSGLQVTAIWGS